jgi:hypothetical protein
MLELVKASLGWSVSLPIMLSMPQYYQCPHISLMPLPQPGVTRKLFVLARAEEHTPILEAIADACRNIIQSQHLNHMQAIHPSSRVF